MKTSNILIGLQMQKVIDTGIKGNQSIADALNRKKQYDLRGNTWDLQRVKNFKERRMDECAIQYQTLMAYMETANI